MAVASLGAGDHDDDNEEDVDRRDDADHQDTAESSWGKELRGLANLTGTFSADFRQRATPSKIDQDFRQSLAVELGDRDRQRVTGSFFGSLTQDIDGVSMAPLAAASEPWFDIDDTFDDNVHGRLYSAYLEFRDMIPGVSRGRVGRQQLLGDLPAHFDGVYAEFEPLATTPWGFYGGVPVNFWEASPAGDYVAGMSLRSTPLRWDPAGYTSVGIEFQRYVDASDAFQGSRPRRSHFCNTGASLDSSRFALPPFLPI